MIKTSSTLNNEEGALMILISVTMLLLLTIISIAASRTANTEISIAANEYNYQRCFYNAEGAILEVIDLMENSEKPTQHPQPWINVDERFVDDSTVFTVWEDRIETSATTSQPSTIDPHHTEYLIVHHGIPPGSSLVMNKPAKHMFSIYGRSKNKGLVMLKVGYTKIY